MSYECDIPEKKVNTLLRCLRQSADRKTEVLLYNIISKTLCGRLCVPVITVIKKDELSLGQTCYVLLG